MFARFALIKCYDESLIVRASIETVFSQFCSPAFIQKHFSGHLSDTSELDSNLDTKLPNIFIIKKKHSPTKISGEIIKRQDDRFINLTFIWEFESIKITGSSRSWTKINYKIYSQRGEYADVEYGTATGLTLSSLFAIKDVFGEEYFEENTPQAYASKNFNHSTYGNNFGKDPSYTSLQSSHPAMFSKLSLIVLILVSSILIPFSFISYSDLSEPDKSDSNPDQLLGQNIHDEQSEIEPTKPYQDDSIQNLKPEQDIESTNLIAPITQDTHTLGLEYPRFKGMTFSQDISACPLNPDLVTHLQILARVTDRLKVSAQGDVSCLDDYLSLSEKYGFKNTIVIDLTNNDMENRDRIAKISAVINNNPANVEMVVVGQNTIYDGLLEPSQLSRYINFAKKSILSSNVKIGTRDAIETWTHYLNKNSPYIKQIKNSSDFIMIEYFPLFWMDENTNNQNTTKDLENALSELSADKKIIVETGWPYVVTYYGKKHFYDQEQALHAILGSIGNTDYFVFEAFSSNHPVKTVYKVSVSVPRTFVLDDFSVIEAPHKKQKNF